MKKYLFPKNGHIYYSVSASSLLNICRLVICDECGSFADHGYLIPVLNHYQCPECFKDCHLHFCNRVYLDDLPIEERYIHFYESHIPVTFDMTPFIVIESGIEYV